MKISKVIYNLIHPKHNIKIMILSDIHYYHKRNIKKLNKVLMSVKDIDPDYICIPGDLIDQRHIKDEHYLFDWLKQLGYICPVIISLGNHEFIKSKKDYFTYDHNFFKNINKINNVYFLDNQCRKIDNLNFIGLSLPGEYYYDHKERNGKYLIDYINKHIKKVNKGYNILLCHTPIELIKIFDKLNIAKSIDLVVCGHTHGGITPSLLKRYLKGRGLISPHRGIFVKNSYGKYKVDNTNIVISSGVTKSSHRNRFACLDFLFAPEITIIDIKGK